MKLRTLVARPSGESTATVGTFPPTCSFLLLSTRLIARTTHRLADTSVKVNHTHRAVNCRPGLLAERVSFQLEVA